MARADDVREPEKVVSIDAEYLSGKRFPYQEKMSEIEGIDLEALTPGKDLNWLEDVELLEEEGTPAVFDRYSNSFLRIYFDIPKGRENGSASRRRTRSSPSPSSARGSRARRPSGRTGTPRSSRAGSPPTTSTWLTRLSPPSTS